MRGLGTIINVLCILGGGIVGRLLGSRFKPRMQETLRVAAGIAVIILGIAGAMEQMLAVTDGKLSSQGSVMMIISLAVGAIIGELIDIDGKVERFGIWLREKSGSTGDAAFVGAFVNASCTVCIGAMAVIGSIRDGIQGDYSILLAKGILDAIIICIMAVSQGKGSIFSAIPVGIFQGLITLIAVFAGDFMTGQALANLSFVGAILIVCVGVNLLREKRIRVANLLPAIFIAAAWGFFQ